MAQKSSISIPVSRPTPRELAREAAEEIYAKTDTSAEQSPVQVTNNQPTSATATESNLDKGRFSRKRNNDSNDKISSISFDVSDIISERRNKVNRTFSLDLATVDRLSEASALLKCPMSTIIEKSFNLWYDAVENKLKKR